MLQSPPCFDSDFGLVIKREQFKNMSLLLSRACLFLIRIKLLILLAAFISIHCLNFELVNWIGSRTEREMHRGTQNKKIGRKLEIQVCYLQWDGMSLEL